MAKPRSQTVDLDIDRVHGEPFFSLLELELGKRGYTPTMIEEESEFRYRIGEGTELTAPSLKMLEKRVRRWLADTFE